MSYNMNGNVHGFALVFFFFININDIKQSYISTDSRHEKKSFKRAYIEKLKKISLKIEMIYYEREEQYIERMECIVGKWCRNNLSKL